MERFGVVADYLDGQSKIKNQLGIVGQFMTIGARTGLGQHSAPRHPAFWRMAAGRRSSMNDRDAGSEQRNAPKHDGNVVVRILVVEDEAWIAIGLQHALTDGGYDVVGLAADAETAIRMAGECEPELVLMDIHLAGPRDGIDAAVKIRERFGIASLFLSGHLDTATRRRAEKARPLGVLDKPVTPQQLLHTIASVLR